MTYLFQVMTQEQAEEIAFQWHYDGEYSFYNMESDRDDLAEFINQEKRGESVYSVLNNNELIGFFSVNKADERIYDIGLGMRPDLTGKGIGFKFLKSGIEFVKSEYKPKKITLSVATFNQRAINVYGKMGFKEIKTFMQATNGSEFEFIKMEYGC
ncbi:GNAT family N-acetyltransferase [Fictibacillus sp. 7GRE50]|uniref:GNAT family N-acetyltransferase n=1 Tax=unclassified Fictibacillus TaxID=2644029 RepID=UPI0018CE033D|nr:MULTISPECIES: GNAT family N-acetyltransferase [unclassified Fictibacillus]MBH0167078.1 GNAT family N-acetyltransferase [Fictibacillus sp. 7GRE50]MBH0174825.1 GNAT family N-acetyltransferase [Fictibacillus sp. 23RED33]